MYLGGVQQDPYDPIDDAVEEVLPAPAKGLEGIGWALHCACQGSAVGEVTGAVGGCPRHDGEPDPRQAADHLQHTAL